MAGAYSAYLTAVQNLLGTTSTGQLYTTAQLTAYINDARQHVAQDAQCIRVLPPIQGPITAITVISGGTGWVNPAVVISQPDSPSGFAPFPNGAIAVASATVSGGQITAVTVTSGGSGYFQPIVSLTSGTGQGTVFAVTVNSGLINATVAGQEIYPFSTVNAMVATSGSGINSIYAVNSVSFLWGTFRYTLMRKSFSYYQAKVRTYTTGYQYIPAVMCQFGQGEGGSLYFYPIPNAPYQMEWDCYCIPNDLNNDSDVEAIPAPYTEAVKYYAAYLAYAQAQRFSDAERMYSSDPKRIGWYQRSLQRARSVSGSRAVQSWYSRT